MALKRMATMRALWHITRDVRRPGAPGLRTRLAAMPRMIGLSLVGRYPQLSRRRLALIVAGVAYLISPIDLIPELLLPLVGWADDAVVLAWLAGWPPSRGVPGAGGRRPRVVPGGSAASAEPCSGGGSPGAHEA